MIYSCGQSNIIAVGLLQNSMVVVGYLELSTVHLYLGPLQNETWEGWYASLVSKPPPPLVVSIISSQD